MGTINFSEKDVRALERACAEAEAKGQDVFTFKGHEFVPAYARYLIEYLRHEFDKRGLLA